MRLVVEFHLTVDLPILCPDGLARFVHEQEHVFAAAKVRMHTFVAVEMVTRFAGAGEASGDGTECSQWSLRKLRGLYGDGRLTRQARRPKGPGN